MAKKKALVDELKEKVSLADMEINGLQERINNSETLIIETARKQLKNVKSFEKANALMFQDCFLLASMKPL